MHSFSMLRIYCKSNPYSYLCHVYLNLIFRRCTKPVLWIICHRTVTWFLVRMHKDDGIWPLTKQIQSLLYFTKSVWKHTFPYQQCIAIKQGIRLNSLPIAPEWKINLTNLHFLFDCDIYYHSSTAYTCVWSSCAVLKI